MKNKSNGMENTGENFLYILPDVLKSQSSLAKRESHLNVTNI